MEHACTASVRRTRKSCKRYQKKKKKTKQTNNNNNNFYSFPQVKVNIFATIKYDDKLHFLYNKSDTLKYLSNKGLIKSIISDMHLNNIRIVAQTDKVYKLLI